MTRLASWTIAALLILAASRQGFGQEQGGLKPRLAAIVAAQEEARRRFSEELQGKTTEAEQKPAVERYLADVANNTGEVLDLVRANPTDPAAVEALRFVIETAKRGPGDESYRAMEILLRDHVRDPGMGDLAGRVFHFAHAPVAEALIRAVLEEHPNREDRGLACHTLSYYLGMRAGMVRKIREGRRTVADYAHEALRPTVERMVRETDLAVLDREAEALLERTIAEFADVKDWFMPGRTLGAVAEGELFATRDLAVGKVAPEIAGEDHEGKPFSLGEYRGKVVVLTFSASWCGPCVGMYPQERELVKTLEGRPFALVSVHSGDEVETLREAIASGEITWRCWWDEGMYGPITTRWGVSAIPEIFVLDRAGVIRKKNVRGAELEEAVVELLAEDRAASR